MSWPRTGTLALALALAAALAAAQAATSPIQESTPPVAAQALAPGDLIAVSVFEAPELATQARVAADGTFRMPEAGTVRLAGKTAVQAAELLAARLRQNYLIQPQVEVLVRSFAPEPVTVAGAVGAPGVYSARTYPTLESMLAAAGGLRLSAGERVLVRPADGAAPISIPVETLARGHVASGLKLHAGEVVRVLAGAEVYVGGDVVKPGAYPLPASGLTLLEALTLAGGTQRDSLASHTRIVHHGAGGKVSTQWVDALGVMQGRALDPRLRAFDLVYVPASLGRATWFAAVRTVTATAAAIVSGVIIFH